MAFQGARVGVSCNSINIKTKNELKEQKMSENFNWKV